MNIEVLKDNFKRYYPYVAVFIFAVITLFILFIRIPFWDEAHQIEIARLNLFQIIKITRVIGHPFLWYFMIKPLSNPNWYPYPVYLFNWIFCMGAIIVLWKKAPFDMLTKTLITFSAPFVLYFAPVARCYSLGIFLLFILCVLYDTKDKHPYLYSFLIVLCANTSVMAMVGSFYLGLLFIYDLFRKKSSALVSVLIVFAICSLLILFQFCGVQKPYSVGSLDFLYQIFHFVILPKGANIKAFMLHLFSSLMFYTIPFYCFKKSKEALFFIFGTFLTLSIIFIFEYNGSYWNHYFYYIYLIAMFWIFYKKMSENKFIKTLFMLILFMFCFRGAIFGTFADLPYSSNSRTIAKTIIKKPDLKNAKLYVLRGWSDISPGADVYLLKEGIHLYDIHNRKKTSYESLKEIYILNNELIDFDYLYKNMEKNSYILSNSDLRANKYVNTLIYKDNDDYYMKTSKNMYYLKNIESRPDIGLYIFKPTKYGSYDKINL